MRLLKKEWKLMITEKEEEVQGQNYVRITLEMIHHDHDHEKWDQIQYDQEQKLCDNTV